MERRKRWLFHPICFAGRFYFRQGKARSRGGARESRAFASIPGAYLQPDAKQQMKGKAMTTKITVEAKVAAPIQGV